MALSQKKLSCAKNHHTVYGFYENLKIPCQVTTWSNQRPRFLKKGVGLVRRCTSSTSSSSGQQVDFDSGKLQTIGTYENKKVQLGYLARDLNWQIRRMFETEEEMRSVAKVQAEAFHEPMFLFDDLFFDFFKAEVLAGLLYRLKNSDPDRYACLVAERRTEIIEPQKELVGVVDVTVSSDGDVLQHLPGAEEYLYVSGIAVSNKFRRQKVATALLKACNVLAGIWSFDYLVLKANEDDYGARKLYSSAGYSVVSADPPWMTTWIGRRRRVLMVKRRETLK